MNVEPGGPARVRPPLLSPLIVAAACMLPAALAATAQVLFGVAGSMTVIGIVVWSEFLLRVGHTSLIGRRRKDKVMAPEVVISFTPHRADPELGWALRASETTRNSFTIPRKGLRLEYTVTTDGDGRRITSKKACGGRVLSIYGCSNTFGWGLNDEESYPWLVQDRFPECRVLNYGVAGYSLYQILLRMEATLSRDKPEVVVLGFSPGLEARSVNDGSYLRMLSEHGGAPPSCLSVERSNGRRHLKRFQPEAYERFPGAQTLMLAKLTQHLLNRMRFRSREGDDKKQVTTQHLLLCMDNLCRNNGTVFLVQYLTSDPRYRSFLSSTGVNWAAGPVDLDACTPDGGYRYRLYPFDGHPNAAASSCYADALEPAVREILDTGEYTRKSGTQPLGDEDESTASAIYPVF